MKKLGKQYFYSNKEKFSYILFQILDFIREEFRIYGNSNN